MYMTVQYLINIDQSAEVLEENEICIVYPHFIILCLTVFEIICNTRQINSQHCYTMLTCLNLAYSAISSLQSMREDCLLLNLISSLYKVSFHLNLYVKIFFISVTMLVDFCTLCCVCVLNCCKECQLFLVLFFS